MAFPEAMNDMRESLQRSLDEISSPRSTLKSKMRALQNLERSLATASFSAGPDSQAKDAFFALQYTFECNVPSRLLPWIMMTTSRLESLTNKGQVDDGRGPEVDELASQLALSLSLIQGVTLNHEASKIHMGRRPALEILLDLLLTSRHLGVPIENPELQGKGASTSPAPAPPLTSLVLDTLLCILVDSSAALRAFEEANGVQSIVKILKRAGTPREVRMKCLEFLYFYLLDETPDSDILKSIQLTLTPPPTAPATPVRAPKPYLNATPLRPPSSRYGSSTFSFSTSNSTSATTTTEGGGGGGGLSTSVSSSTSTSSRSTSGSSIHSFSSTSSNASSSTAASSMPASPVKDSFPPPPGLLSKLPSAAAKSPAKKRTLTPMTRRQLTPPSSSHSKPNSNSNSTPNSNANSNSTAKLPQVQLQLRSMMMLRKEVEYVPLSPKKMPMPVSGSGSGSSLVPKPGHRKSLSASASAFGSPSGHLRSRSQATLPLPLPLIESAGSEDSSSRTLGRDASMPNLPSHDVVYPKAENKERRDKGERDRDWKTTEEKKELLGTMLGNVDALVEGVRKAGIWGLG